MKKNNALKNITSRLTSQFLTGLAVMLPVALTVFIVLFLLSKLDSILAPIFTKYLGVTIPGLGLITLILLVWITGLVARNYFGRQFVRLYESILQKTPMINTIFSALKQISDNLFTNKGNSFKQVVLVRSPFHNVNTIGFITSDTVVTIGNGKKSSGMVHVFIPFTPPTSGFIVIVPKKDVIPLDLSVEDGLKVAVSIGVIHPKKYTVKKLTTAGKNKK